MGFIEDIQPRLDDAEKVNAEQEQEINALAAPELGTLTQRVTTAEQDIATTDRNLQAVETAVSELGVPDVATLTQRVDTLEDVVALIAGRVRTLKANQAEDHTRIATLEARPIVKPFDPTAILTRLTTLEAAVKVLQPAPTPTPTPTPTPSPVLLVTDPRRIAIDRWMRRIKRRA